MYGMPILQAVYFAASVIVLLCLVQWRRLHPFLAIVLVAAAFGVGAGFSSGLVGKSFGTGFSQAIASTGLVIIAAGFVAAFADSAGAFDWIAARISRCRRFGSTKLAAVLGLVAGLGASSAAVFTVLTPFLRAISGASPPRREAATVSLALAISASHGLVVFSPIPIAAATILGAPWQRVVLFGLPIAVVLAVIGAAWARYLAVVVRPVAPPIAEEPSPKAPTRGAWPATVMLLATAVPVLLLIAQSLGEMPSEPLGGGRTREMILGFGRPLVLFLVAFVIMAAGLWRLSLKAVSDDIWTSRALANIAGPLLIVGAAGGLQSLCQETGMAELVGEHLLGIPGGVLIPFLVAATIKTLLGSSLVAAIAAAGMVQPLLAPLGLAGDSGKALAALAVGAGAMTMSHVNDEYFWLVSTSAGLSARRALVAVTGGTLVQGLVAVAALLLLSALTAGI
jgi:gluconate:H+ symporter, GntP family